MLDVQRRARPGRARLGETAGRAGRKVAKGWGGGGLARLLSRRSKRSSFGREEDCPVQMVLGVVVLGDYKSERGRLYRKKGVGGLSRSAKARSFGLNFLFVAAACSRSKVCGRSTE